MYLIQADYILTCNNSFDILKNTTILFNKKIIDIGNIDKLKKQYPKAIVLKKEKNSVILPGLINTHLHLEFSSNKTTLKYGNFIKWLYSVIKYRQKIIQHATKDIIDKEIKTIISSGTTSLGAISSYGLELDSLAKSGLRVVYFNEVIGSQEKSANDAFLDLKNRFEKSKKYKSNTFTPAIAIHSIYSVHTKLLKLVTNFIKKNNLLASVHFLESKYERKWLQRNSGKFKTFFYDFFQNKTPTMSIKHFLEEIKSLPHLLFTHNNYMKKKEFNFIKKNKSKFYITHCPTSNLLLGSKKIKFSYLKKLQANIGTDGLSSNTSLSMFDEIRNALIKHSNININNLAKQLILFATRNGAKALKINSGEVSIGKNADLIMIKLPDTCETKDVTLNTILHTKKISKSFINGKMVYSEK